MSTSLSQNSRERHPVAHSVGGQAIQTIQGLYYVVAGLWVALLLPMFQTVTGPRFDMSHLWVVRVVALVVAGVGTALIASGRRKEGPFVGASVAISVATVLFVLDTACVALGALPPLFLIDVGVELGFACWWAVAGFIWVGTAPDRSVQEPPNSRTAGA